MPPLYPLCLLAACWLATFLPSAAIAALVSGEVHVWEMQEIIFEASRDYANPYAEVDCWIELTGPDFSRRVHNFWDGGRSFRVRFVATAPGE